MFTHPHCIYRTFHCQNFEDPREGIEKVVLQKQPLGDVVKYLENTIVLT